MMLPITNTMVVTIVMVVSITMIVTITIGIPDCFSLAFAFRGFVGDAWCTCRTSIVGEVLGTWTGMGQVL
jgi:hypothetical protein